MPTIAVYSRKGGQGKTTLTLDLAVLAAGDGARVLLVDADPQCSLSGMLLPGGDSDVSAIPTEQTAAALVRGDRVCPVQVRDLVWLVPGSHHLRAVPGATWSLPAGDYDAIVIDTPPSFTDGLVRQALAHADTCLTPLTPEPLSVQAAGGAMEMFASVAAVTNPRLRHAGLVLTQVRKGVAVHAAVEGLLREMFGNKVLAATIPQASAVSEASGLGKSVVEHAPKSAVTKAIRGMAEELGQRLANQSQRAA